MHHAFMMMFTEARGEAILQEACIFGPFGLTVQNPEELEELTPVSPVSVEVSRSGRARAGTVSNALISQKYMMHYPPLSR